MQHTCTSWSFIQWHLLDDFYNKSDRYVILHESIQGFEIINAMHVLLIKRKMVLLNCMRTQQRWRMPYASCTAILSTVPTNLKPRVNPRLPQRGSQLHYTCKSSAAIDILNTRIMVKSGWHSAVFESSEVRARKQHGNGSKNIRDIRYAHNSTSCYDNVWFGGGKSKEKVTKDCWT